MMGGGGVEYPGSPLAGDPGGLYSPCPLVVGPSLGLLVIILASLYRSGLPARVRFGASGLGYGAGRVSGGGLSSIFLVIWVRKFKAVVVWIAGCLVSIGLTKRSGVGPARREVRARFVGPRASVAGSRAMESNAGVVCPACGLLTKGWGGWMYNLVDRPRGPGEV
jgi:hypothetical protein